MHKFFVARMSPAAAGALKKGRPEMATAKKAAPRRAAKTAEAPAQAAESFAATARDQFDTLFTAFNEQAETFRGQSEEFAETVRSNFEAAQSRFQSTSAEIMNAAREDLAGAVDFANELARAKTVADALEIQRTYWTGVFETRVERARGYANAAVETARESFEPFTKPYAGFVAPSFEKFFPFAAK